MRLFLVWCLVLGSSCSIEETAGIFNILQFSLEIWKMMAPFQSVTSNWNNWYNNWKQVYLIGAEGRSKKSML